MNDEIAEKHDLNKNIIFILQTMQDKFGYIPEDRAKEISKKLNIPLVRLWGVATFYSQFKFKKPGKYMIQVCNGTACHVNNSAELINFLKEELKISEGETTKDGLFTLELVNCMGACARAPTMAVNGKVYGNLNSKKIKEIIRQYREQETQKQRPATKIENLR